MLNEIKRILEDIREGKNIEQYIFAGLAIVVAVLDLLGVVNISIVFATTLAVLAVLLFGHAQNRRQFEQLASQRQTLGISEFSVDRSNVPSIHSLLHDASTEVLLIGVALTSVLHSNRSLLEHLANRGCKIKLAIWNPPDDETTRRILIDRLEDVIDEPDTERSHPSNIERLKYWYSSLDETTRAKVEIRGYSNFPTLSIIFVDRDTPHGYIHVEPIIFKASTEKLPSFRLGVQNSPSLFGVLNENYQKLWNGAESLVTNIHPNSNGKANSA
jgi:hypothetical protein